MSVEKWSMYEAAFAGPAEGNPFVDVELSAEFSQGSTPIKVPGFYDGEGRYKVRFMPSEEGDWKYTTRSNVAALDGRQSAEVDRAAGTSGSGRA